MAGAIGAGCPAVTSVVRAQGCFSECELGKASSSRNASFRSFSSSFRGSAICRGSSGSSRQPPLCVLVVCAQDLKEQIKEMAAAEKRWELQVKEGRVKSLSSKEAGRAIQSSEYTFLDVRPSTEHNKAWVSNSVWIPLFEPDTNFHPGAILKRISNFAMGGWWNGIAMMKYNQRFMPDVVAKIPKSANIIVACQKGLRSLAACEQLYRAGYRNLYWLNGGLDAADDSDFVKEGSTPFKFAGLGGVSEFLGWTDVQRAAAQNEGLGYRAMLFGRLMIVVLSADLLFLGAQQLIQRFQDTNH